MAAVPLRDQIMPVNTQLPSAVTAQPPAATGSPRIDRVGKVTLPHAENGGIPTPLPVPPYIGTGVMTTGPVHTPVIALPHAAIVHSCGIESCQ